MAERLYVVSHQPDNGGCPHFFSEEVAPTEWEWDTQDPKPFDVKITRSYSSKVTDTEVHVLDFDFYGSDSKYVSDRFVELCRACGVKFRPVPLDIRHWDDSRPNKSYFVFLPADHLSILDTAKSEAEVELIVETGEVMTHRFFPDLPVYKMIKKFVVKEVDVPPLFHCVEIDCLVCTDDFRQQCINLNLRGIKFVPLDENFVYNPWAGW